MAGLLGLRQVTRLRYGSPSYSGLDPVRPSPTTETIWASIDVAPRSEWAPDDGGQRTRRVVDVLTRTELRGADDGGQTYADRLVVDGRTYEVQTVDRLDPFEGDPTQHFEVRAVEVQPLADPAIAPAAPTNLTIPTIQGERGEGLTVLFTSGTWAGGQPMTFAYSVLLDGVEVSTSTEWTDTAETVDQTLQVVVTATNSAGSATAESQPLGGGGVVDCEVTCAATIAAAVAAAVAPLEAEIAGLEAQIVLLDAQIAADAITIAALEAEIAGLEAQIVLLEAEIVQLEADVISAFAAGAASITNQFRSFGKRLFRGETPLIYNPNSLATGAYSVDAAGSITVPLATGISAGLPSTGYALVLPATSSLGRALIAGDFSWAVLRACLEAQAGTTGTLRFGVCLMNADNPTTAQGWGVALQATAAGYFSFLLAAATAGAWTGNAASTTRPITEPVEGSIVQRTTANQPRTAGRIDPATGLPSSGVSGTSAITTPAPVSFAGGTWVCVFWGASDALVTAGNYTGRAVTSINDSVFTDSAGV